jgi:acetoin utilization protein AcuB
VKKRPVPIHPKTLREMRVTDIMNRRPRTVGPHTSIDGLLERLLSQIEDCFPVVDKNRKLLGIVTESDVLQVFQAPSRRATVGHMMMRQLLKRSASTVGEIMTKRPITVRPETSVQELINLMTAHKLRHLPVVRNGRLVGLVCLRDVIELHRILR